MTPPHCHRNRRRLRDQERLVWRRQVLTVACLALDMLVRRQSSQIDRNEIQGNT